MLRRVWATWAAVALGALVGCGGSQGNGSTSTTTTTTTTNTGGSGGTGGAPPACGDGAVDTGEACDDGNTADGDGCSPTCTVEKGYTCSGAPSVCGTTCGDGIIAGAEACDDGNTTPGDGCSALCAVESGFDCTGEPSACVTTCGDGIIAGAEACDDGNTADADGCSQYCAIEAGWSCDMEPTYCTEVHGDGIIVGTEACDDNNPDNGDGCTADAQIENGWYCTGAPSACATQCGDSIIAGGEACDDGDAADGDGCSASCGIETGWYCSGEPSICATQCSDGIVAGAEICDDGNTANGDGCDMACAVVEPGWTCTGSPSACVTTCGDGVIAGLEKCDDSNVAAADGCDATCQIEAGFYCTGAPSACATQCGDGVVAGAEKCDDKNLADGDGCTATCLLEAGWTCTGAPSACVTTCGDSVIAGTEVCDDGNGSGGDGCSAACTVEPGWTCTGVPSVCTTTCGDGITAGNEACDDGNAAPGDGCDASCQIENGYGCSGAPSVCGAVCGDGIKLPSEKCDDGNLTNGDCCSSTCQVESGCEIEANDTVATANDFAALSVANKIKGFINPTTDKDLYLVVVPPGTIGTIKAENRDGPFTTCASNKADSRITIYASNGTTSLGTDDDSGDGFCARVTVSGLAPGNYYVEVKRSSAGNATYDYTLEVTLSLAICGNGIQETGEQCDDGNGTNGDGCSTLCKLESTPEAEPNNSCAAANGAYNIPPNKLISGAITPTADQDWYRFTLTNYADVRVETFDATGPGNCATIDTDVQMFDASCNALGPLNDDEGINLCSLLDPTVTSQAFMKHLPPGTYYVKVNEHGDNATISGYTLLVSTVALCGNGIKEGSEQCDGDAGCGADCNFLPVCGNGQVQAAETCDDGNTTAGDGCSATCSVEAGWLCSSATPSVCTRQEINCNDGIDNDGDGQTDGADSDCAFAATLVTPCAAGQTLLIYNSVDVPKTIADADPNGGQAKIPVSLSGTVQRAVVKLDITHTWDTDVDITLISPSGTNIDLSSDNGSSNDHYTNTVFDDACPTNVTSGSAPFSGCFHPEVNLATVNGQSITGTWTLKAVDDAAGIAGTLNSFTLALCVQ